jgi:hypothetical protein
VNTTVEIRCPIAKETLVVSSTALPLTASAYDRDGLSADQATITCETDAVRYWADGSIPTASVGHVLAAAGALLLYGQQAIQNFRVIRVTNDATLSITYSRSQDS